MFVSINFEDDELFCVGGEVQSGTRILASLCHIKCKKVKKNPNFKNGILKVFQWQGSFTKQSAHSSSPSGDSDSFSYFMSGDSGRASFSCLSIGDSGREGKRPSSSDWRSTWLGSASQISSSYAFVLNFSVISSMKMLYMVESMFLETRKIMNQSPVDALVTRW